MAESEGKFSWPTDLNVTIHEVLRYGYGGLLLYTVAALSAPEKTKTVLETLGTTVSVIAAFVLGAAIYTGHRALAELLYLFHELVHIRLSRLGQGCTCRSAYFLDKWPEQFGQPAPCKCFRFLHRLPGWRSVWGWLLAPIRGLLWALRFLWALICQFALLDKQPRASVVIATPWHS